MLLVIVIQDVMMNKQLRYIVPNLFTISSLFAGLAALHFTAQTEFVRAAWFVTLSIVLDGLDGKTARLLCATSKFGAEADSFADFVAFGVVPGFLAWQICLKNFGLLGMSVFAFYVLCGGFRLVRFNLGNKNPNVKSDFQGLPIPAGAAVIASFILFTHKVFATFNGDVLFLFVTIFTSFLMVSHVPYVAVNKSPHCNRSRNIMISVVLVALALSVKYFSYVYIVSIWAYIFSGFMHLISQLIHMKMNKRNEIERYK